MTTPERLRELEGNFPLRHYPEPPPAMSTMITTTTNTAGATAGSTTISEEGKKLLGHNGVTMSNDQWHAKADRLKKAVDYAPTNGEKFEYQKKLSAHLATAEQDYWIMPDVLRGVGPRAPWIGDPIQSAAQKFGGA